MDDEQKKTEANGIRRAVEASGSGTGRKLTAAQEQDRRVYFTTEEVEEAREWQEKILRNREARGEESREPEKKGSEDGDDEWVPVVPNMEAGGTCLQTTDPKDAVEKIVMDELEERKTGRGSDGLVRGGSVQMSGERDQWKRKREGRRRKRRT